MDILGAIALCTEPWVEGIKLPRVRRTTDIMSAGLWKLIFVQAAYQILVLIILMFFYGAIAYQKVKPTDEGPPNLFTTPLRKTDGNATNRLKMDTFIYHTFILMCIFNQLSTRNIDPLSMNPFQNIQNHLTFVFVFILEIGVQQAMIM